MSTLPSKLKVCIAVFLYNRPAHTAQLCRSILKLEQFSEVPILVFIDGPRGAADAKAQKSLHNIVESELRPYWSNLEVAQRVTNLGLRTSVILGVEAAFSNFDAVIVLEDDLELHPQALIYFMEALERYRYSPLVGSVCGYSYPSANLGQGEPHYCIALRRACSWGWATWKDRWDAVDWSDETMLEVQDSTQFRAEVADVGDDLVRMARLQLRRRISSWAISWNLHHIKNKLLCVYPPSSLVSNSGFDGSGQHCSKPTRASGADITRRLEVREFIWTEPQITKSADRSLSQAHRYSLAKRLGSYLGL